MISRIKRLITNYKINRKMKRIENQIAFLNKLEKNCMAKNYIKL